MAYKQYDRNRSVTVDGKSVDEDGVYRPDGAFVGWGVIGFVLAVILVGWVVSLHFTR